MTDVDLRTGVEESRRTALSEALNAANPGEDVEVVADDGVDAPF